MGAFSFWLDRLRRCAPAVLDAGALKRGERNGRCDASLRCEPPMSFSELIAASSFLDLGGMIEERWLARRFRDGPELPRVMTEQQE
jgi:hypothetical protein